MVFVLLIAMAREIVRDKFIRYNIVKDINNIIISFLIVESCYLVNEPI